MIDLTGEMLQLAHRALAPDAVMPPGLVKALRGVLDLVDRDHDVRRWSAPLATLEQCTHGADCGIHPGVGQLHNLDHA